jgi:hypothetical protein
MRRHIQLSDLAIPVAVISLLALTLSCKAQWSSDPANPMVLCAATGTPENLVAFGDGNGGYYAFWRDRRTDGTNYDMYGQRLDEAGYPLWTAGGKLIHHEDSCTVGNFAISRLADGNLMLATIAGPSLFADTMKAMLLDADAAPLWPNAVNITKEGSPILGIGELAMIPKSGGAIIGWYDTYFGGSNGVNVTRIENDGTQPWGMDGYAIPYAAYGPFELHDDYGQGVIVQWRTGNGSGAALMAMRVDSSGTNVWPANVQTSAGNDGLNYAFHTVQDGLGAQITAWRSMPGHLVMARLDTSGALTFNPSPLVVCDYASSQDKPKLVRNGGALYAAWVDNRPPASNADLYVQKFNANGAPLWAADGVPALQLNTYIPTTGIVASDSGAVIVTMDGNVDGYSAMRVRGNGTLAWNAPAQFCLPGFNPFYERQIQLADGEGGVVSFWSNSIGELYGARIYRNGQLVSSVGVAENSRNHALTVFPNPASDRITISADEEILSIRVLDMQGRTLQQQAETLIRNIQLDISSLAPGTYMAVAHTQSGRLTGRFEKR